MAKGRTRGQARGRPGEESVRMQAAPVLPPVPTGETGFTGTVIWNGRLHTENNDRLKGERGLGRGETWGEWEKLARTDPAVVSALELVAAPLREATVEVEPGGEDKRSIQVADFVRDCLQEWMEPQWPDYVEQSVKGALGEGFSLHELVYGLRRDVRVPGGQAVFVRKLAERLPSSLAPNAWLEEGGELAHVVQQGVRDGRWVSEVRLPADKLLLFSWQRRGNNYAGYSAFRSVWYLCQVRAELLRIVGIGHERESLGVPTATADADVNLTQPQMDDLEELLANISAHEKSYAVMPPGVKWDWVFSQGANKGNVMDTWKALGEAIHQVVHTQQVTLGSSETGSRAVGEVHDSGRRAFVMGVKAALEATINGVGSRPYTGLVSRLVLPNFGPQARLPRVKLVLQRDELGTAAVATAVPTLVQSGALTWRAEDENKLREKMGLTPIDEQERAAAQAARTPAPAPAPGEGEDPGRFPFAAAPPATFRPKRPLRPEERHLKLADMARFMDTARDTFEADAKPLLEKALRRALPDIQEAMADGNPSEVASLQLPLEEVEDAVEDFIERCRTEGYRQARGEKGRQPEGLLEQRGEGKAAMSVRMASAEEEEDAREDEEWVEPPPGDILPETPRPQPRREVEAQVQRLVRSMRANLLRRMRARMVDALEAEAIDVVRTGGNPVEVVERVVARTLETRALRQDAGSVLTKSFNMGREQFAQEHGSEVAAVKYSAILDGKQCTACDGVDGKEFRFNSPEHEAHVPPYRECKGGANCRCLMIYLYKDQGFRPVEEAR